MKVIQGQKKAQSNTRCATKSAKSSRNHRETMPRHMATIHASLQDRVPPIQGRAPGQEQCN
jgi:hypothetical protein